MDNLSAFVFIFAHGAGADKDSDWMLAFDEMLTKAGIEVNRFNFPYMDKRKLDGKRRPPDRQPKLLEAFANQVNDYKGDKHIIIGGKSMGGRMASLLVAEPSELTVELSKVLSDKVAGVLCLGFPFHPPGKPEKFRGDHFVNMKIPTLILQGERDTFGTKDECDQWSFSEQVTLKFLPDGDHSFKPRKRSGYTEQENMTAAASHFELFLKQLND